MLCNEKTTLATLELAAGSLVTKNRIATGTQIASKVNSDYDIKISEHNALQFAVYVAA